MNIYNNNKTNAENKARNRVANSDKLSEYSEIIFSDWKEWDEHMEWIASASVAEIIDWAQSVTE